MRAVGREREGIRRSSLVVGVLIAILLLAAAFESSAARADYGQLSQHFGASGEAAQLEGAKAIAINVSGGGGVEPGSIYVVGLNGRVLRYARIGGEEPAFREAWGWGVGDGTEEFQRCGPAYAAEPRPAHTFPTCTSPPSVAPFAPDEEPFNYGHFETPGGVAVNQANGDVYVLNSATPNIRERNLIEVFTATGDGITHFGESGRQSPAPPESIAEGPSKLHELPVSNPKAITVSDAGTVYVTDRDYTGVENGEARIMSFVPQTSGNFEHYVYAGQGSDIVATLDQPFERLALVDGSRIVAANSGLLREFALGGGSTPVCSQAVTGQLRSMAANFATGEVFYFTGGDGSLHRVGPCDEATGKFATLQAPIVAQPATNLVSALSVDPSLVWGSQRPPGVVYGIDAKRHFTPLQPGIGDIFVPAQFVLPAVASESVSSTTSISTTLNASIETNGFTTAYQFQYLTSEAYAAQLATAEAEGKTGTAAEDAAFTGASVTPGSEGHVDAGGIGLASGVAAGLQPATNYRFRVVITNQCSGVGQPACEVRGRAAAFATYPSPSSVFGVRAFELVSPSLKYGGEAFPAAPRLGSCLGHECKPPGQGISVVFPMQSAPDGNTVAYMGYAFSPTEGASVFNSYIGRRTVAGWQTSFMSPAALSTKGGENLAFSDALTEGVLSQSEPQLASSAPAGYANLYLEDTNHPDELMPLLETPPPHRAQGGLVVKYDGYSPSFSAQYFSANDSLTAATPYAPEPADPGSAGQDLYEWTCSSSIRPCRTGHLALVNVLPGNAGVASGSAFVSASPDAHPVSDNGQRVFWHVGSSVYVREDAQITRELAHSGTFLTSSADGLTVLFSDGCLYSLLTESCTDLSGGQGGFQGISGQSEDLSRIYFVDTAVLDGLAQAGKDNLYLYDAESGTTTFIATLASSDNAGGGGAGVNEGALADWVAAAGLRSAEASPNGRFLAFGSTEELTGYKSVGACAEGGGVVTSSPCKEIFVYDSATGRLTCSSCNPTGEAPLGNSTLRRIEGLPIGEGRLREWIPQPRYLTNAGRLFFDSSDRLSSLDTNGRVEDVYEAVPDRVGSCGRPGGCVSLISAGTGSVDSNFLAMDESGANVFFTTRERLVPADTDGLIDVYDAREGGGFPSEAEVESKGCSGEACQAQGNPMSSPTAATSTSQGGGNVTPGEPPKCAKGQVKKNGKCVKRKAKSKKNHHEKTHRKRGAQRRPTSGKQGGPK